MNNFDVSSYLKNAVIENNTIKLPEGQIGRDEYLQVKKSLEGIGGKWKGGKVSAFVFDTDPTDLLKRVVGGETVNLKKEFQFFETPDELALQLVIHASISNNDTVLEPSAGRGAIIKAFNNLYKTITPHCYEIMESNRIFLKESRLRFILVGNDFLEDREDKYSKIIANPPFSKNQDIDHIYEMYNRLEPGGRLVSLASIHWTFSENKKETAFREWLSEHDAETIDIDRGAFKQSGTMIPCCIIIIDSKEPIEDNITPAERIPHTLEDFDKTQRVES